MATTALELCAAALLKVGAQPIDSLDGDTVEATCARRFYGMIRDALLCAHPWTFARAQIDLMPQATAPIADFAYAFTLPADHLRTISVGARGSGRGVAYRLQGGSILCDAEAITLTYQRRVDEGDLPAFFLPLLVNRLAAELCVPLTENTSRAGDLLRLAEAELRLARLVDSQQGTPRQIDDFTLVAVRG
ncbi:MAG: hypothetical protein U1E17_13170 [Geminicoccaceae bacterium]